MKPAPDLPLEPGPGSHLGVSNWKPDLPSVAMIDAPKVLLRILRQVNEEHWITPGEFHACLYWIEEGHWTAPL